DPLIPPSQLRPGVTSAVDAVLAKALLPAAKKRWASARTFATALARALERMSGEIKLPPIDDELIETAADSVLKPTQGIDEVSVVGPLPGPEVTGRVRAAHLRVLS